MWYIYLKGNRKTSIYRIMKTMLVSLQLQNQVLTQSEQEQELFCVEVTD